MNLTLRRAQIVGDRFGHGIDDTHIKIRGAPVLDEAALDAHQKMIADKLQARGPGSRVRVRVYSPVLSRGSTTLRSYNLVRSVPACGTLSHLFLHNKVHCIHIKGHKGHYMLSLARAGFRTHDNGGGCCAAHRQDQGRRRHPPQLHAPGD